MRRRPLDVFRSEREERRLVSALKRSRQQSFELSLYAFVLRGVL